MIKKALPIIAILSLSVTPALTQSDSSNGYSVQHFTDENGLPQNSINDLLFDNDGYLWLASQVGLVCFNGNSFKLYYPNDKRVMESDILFLGKNDKGTLYFQTDDHNLYCYPRNNVQYMAPVITPSEVQKKPWLLNDHRQLFDFSAFLHSARNAGETAQRQKVFQYLFANNRNFYAVDTTRLYYTYNDSLYYYDGRQQSAITRLPGGRGQYLVQDKKLYILHQDSVLAVYAEGRRVAGASLIGGDLSKELSLVKKGGDDYRLYPCTRATHLLAGRRLYRLTPTGDGGLNTAFLVNLDFIPNISAVEYNSGLDLLMVATHTEGFYFLRKNRFKRNGWPLQLRQKMDQHLFGPLAIYQDRKILTDKFIFTPAGQLIPIKDAVPVWQRCLYVDKKDQVWAAWYNRPRRLDSAMDLVLEPPALDATIVDYSEDSAGHLYCLTGSSVWQLKGDSFLRVFTIPRLTVREANESFAYVGGGCWWIAGTYGLLEYDQEKKRARAIPEFTGMHVRAIHICKDGNILVGTYGQGYFYYYRHRWVRMPLDKNGFLVTAHCFLEDRSDNVWIPCNKGLFKVPRADMDAWCDGSNNGLYYYYYGRQDGLLTNEFNGGFNASGVITPGNFVALSSMKGMVCFYTDSLRTDFPHGAIDIRHVETDGTILDISDTIRLKAGYNSLLMEISCPYLGNPNNLYLQYNVEGLGDEWRPVPADGILPLNRLEAGSYMLRVRKVNGFGKNNYQYREWRLVVPPYFYKTTWFMLLLALAVLILLFLLIRLRLKLVEKKKEIGVKAEKLKGAVVSREKLISLVIHDLRSPLRFLTLLAGDLHDNQGRLSAEEIKDRTYWVKKGAQDIYNFSEDFLLWVTSQTDQFSINKQRFAVRPLLQEIFDFFLEQVQQRGNSISYEAAEDLTIYSDPHMLLTIIRNLVDNANKYTSQGSIRITASVDDASVLISVADTGKGMSPQQVAAFLGDDSLDNVKSGSQLGHKFIYDLTQRLNGTLSVESIEQKGTTISIRLPY